MTERERAIEVAVAQIERQFGKGAIMTLGDGQAVAVDAIPTGSIALDLALGIGGIHKAHSSGPHEQPPVLGLR